MVPALKNPRPRFVLSGFREQMRGEVHRPAPGCAGKLCDPFTGKVRSGDVVPSSIRAMILSRNDRITGPVAPLVPWPSPGPVCPGAWIAPDRVPLTCHGPCLLPVLFVPGGVGAFLPCQGFAVAAFPL